MANQIHVQAAWDSEVQVWIATSDEVPGLATEADTIEELETKLHTMVPELLRANGRHQIWPLVIERSEIPCLD